jgi:hypothetical protein
MKGINLPIHVTKDNILCRRGAASNGLPSIDWIPPPAKMDSTVRTFVEAAHAKSVFLIRVDQSSITLTRL